MTERAWRTLERRTVLSRPPWYEIDEERVVLPDGRILDGYAAMRLREHVTVVALTADREILLERLYKHGARAVTLDVPAGLIDDGEAPLAAARRELLEETGHAADRWISLGSYVVNSNYGCGRMHAFLALDAHRVAEPNSSDLEVVTLLKRPFEEALASVGDEIILLSAAAAIALAAAHLRRDAAD